jgi:murein L,D-transpeptidase YafK
MLHLVYGAVVLVAHLAGDTATARSAVGSPTILRMPVVGVRSFITADSIVVEKHKHKLTLFQLGIPVRTYQVALGKQPVGDKLRIGDNRTPEGLFHIDYKNPDSRYHMALHISYPDAEHVAKSRAAHAKPGGDIMIHGLPAAYADLGAKHRLYDWTEGCIAVTNVEIDEIWRAIPPGSPILIKP